MPEIAAVSHSGAQALLEVNKIRQLIEMMVANDLAELSLRDGDVEVCLRRPGVGGGPVAVEAAPPTAPGLAVGEADENAGLAEIISPMVGTFYSGPDPDSPPFVKVGSTISSETVVCIVEAMKVFNEIKAEVSGTVEGVLVTNEEPVEFGQAMFLVRPR